MRAQLHCRRSRPLPARLAIPPEREMSPHCRAPPETYSRRADRSRRSIEKFPINVVMSGRHWVSVRRKSVTRNRPVLTPRSGRCRARVCGVHLVTVSPPGVGLANTADGMRHIGPKKYGRPTRRTSTDASVAAAKRRGAGCAVDGAAHGDVRAMTRCPPKTTSTRSRARRNWAAMDTTPHQLTIRASAPGFPASGPRALQNAAPGPCDRAARSPRCCSALDCGAHLVLCSLRQAWGLA